MVRAGRGPMKGFDVTRLFILGEGPIALGYDCAYL